MIRTIIFGGVVRHHVVENAMTLNVRPSEVASRGRRTMLDGRTNRWFGPER